MAILPNLSGAATQLETAPVWSTYLDVDADVRPYLNDDLQSNEALLTEFTAMACDAVQDALNRPAVPTTFFRRYDGWSGNGSQIVLDYHPITDVPLVTEYWSNSGVYSLALQTPEAQGDQYTFQLDALNGVITRTFGGLFAQPFFPGVQNIEVTFQAGPPALKPAVKVATLELISYWMQNTQNVTRVQGWSPTGYDSDREDSPGSGPRSMADMPPHVRMLLGRLRSTTIA